MDEIGAEEGGVAGEVGYAMDPLRPQFPHYVDIFSFDEIMEFTNDLGEQIGEGAEGDVYRGHFPADFRGGQLIAVKGSKSGKEATALREAKALAMFPHPNIVALWGVGSTINRFFMVMPLKNHSLYEIFINMTWSNTVKILIDCAEGLKYLHDRGYFFRDFKPQQVLLDEDFNAVLADFGGVAPGNAFRIAGTEGYMDLEWAVTPTVTEARNDIFSFGVVLLQLIAQHENVLNPNLVEWARENYLLKKKNLVVMKGCRKADAERITDLGIRCIDKLKARRPNNMDEVLQVLRSLRTDKPSSLLNCFRGC